MLHVAHGSNKLHHKLHGAQENVVIPVALQHKLDIVSEEDLAPVLNRRLQLGSNSLFVVTYLGKASGRLHEAVLPKFLNTFFCCLLDSNVPSTNCRATDKQKGHFPRLLDTSEANYGSVDYSSAWLNTCHRALADVTSAGSTVV